MALGEGDDEKPLSVGLSEYDKSLLVDRVIWIGHG